MLNIKEDNDVFVSSVFSSMGVNTEILEKNGVAKIHMIKKILISCGKLDVTAKVLAGITYVNESLILCNCRRKFLIITKLVVNL